MSTCKEISRLDSSVMLRILKKLFDKHYRYFYWTWRINRNSRRYTERTFHTPVGVVRVPDTLSFIWQYKEIFIDEIYNFKAKNAKPVIIDCGANIGLSGIYFKQKYPGADLYLIEADPEISKYCLQNLEKNNASFKEFVQKAAWIDDKSISFSREGSDGGSLQGQSNLISVDGFRFRDFLSKFNSVDFLKMDIEGAEDAVVPDCEDQLCKIQNLFVEYHSWTQQDQKLSKLLSVLEDQGFRYYIDSINKKHAPFLKSKTNEKMDLQVNIFATRA